MHSPAGGQAGGTEVRICKEVAADNGPLSSEPPLHMHALTRFSEYLAGYNHGQRYPMFVLVLNYYIVRLNNLSIGCFLSALLSEVVK